PFLEEGFTYDKAVEKAGMGKDMVGNRDYMPIISPDEIRNPVVLRAVSQNRKLVKEIVRKYGYPTYIHLELAREMGKSRKDRRAIEQTIDENTKNNKTIDGILREEFHITPNKTDRLKYKLWQEQNHCCL